MLLNTLTVQCYICSTFSVCGNSEFSYQVDLRIRCAEFSFWPFLQGCTYAAPILLTLNSFTVHCNMLWCIRYAGTANTQINLRIWDAQVDLRTRCSQFSFCPFDRFCGATLIQHSVVWKGGSVEKPIRRVRIKLVSDDIFPLKDMNIDSPLLLLYWGWHSYFNRRVSISE